VVFGRKGDFSAKQSGNSTDITTMKHRCANLIALAAAVLPLAWPQASSGPSPSPASLTFSYTVNSTALPAAAKLTISLPTTASSANVISVSPSYPPGTPDAQVGWLTVAPSSGHAPLALSVVANPTSLPPGSYNATLSVTTNPNVGSTSVSVTLSVANPQANLVVNPGLTTANFTPASGTTPDTLSFAYTTGAAWTGPASELDVSTNGGIIPFNVTAANAAASGSGGKGSTPVWLRVALGPLGASGQPGLQTSGVAVAGSSVPISVSLDQTSVQSLLPGSYGGTITFAATSAANGSHLVSVNLIVSAGAPAVSSIFPTSITQAPAVNPLVTINGLNFFSTSVVTLAAAGAPQNNQCTQNGTPVQVSSQLLSQTAMTATINNAQTLFANPGSWCICVTNPAPPNAPGQPPACTPTPNPPAQPFDYTFMVISNSQIAVTSVLNAASYQPAAKQVGTNPDPVMAGQTSIAPGEIVSIFGRNLGPVTPLPATPGATPAILTSSAPLTATLNTSGLLTTLQFTVAGASGSTNVTVNFAADPNVANNESLANIVAHINGVANTAGLGISVASLQTVLGSNYIALTSPASGAAAAIKVTDNAAARLLNLTAGNGDVTAAGAALGFPYQLNNIQLAFQFTNTQTSALTTVYAPIIMIANNQINAMAPFGVAGGIGGTATLVVQNGASSATFPNLVVVNENPGIFTLSGQGSGQAAVLNYDAASGSYTVNSSKNTAPRGSTVVIFATGLGTLQPPGLADGVAAAVADKVGDPVQVTIGGQPCVVTYAGTSPGSIGGLAQINAIVPPTVATGQAVPITIAGGSAQTARQSQSGVTLAVK
jgi:uncharacterized protein (TIGR03437 family)